MFKTTWMANPAYHIGLQLREYRNDGLSLKQPAQIVTKFKNDPTERNIHQRDILINQVFKPENRLQWEGEWGIYYTDLSLSQLDLVKAAKTNGVWCRKP